MGIAFEINKEFYNFSLSNWSRIMTPVVKKCPWLTEGQVNELLGMTYSGVQPNVWSKIAEESGEDWPEFLPKTVSHPVYIV